MDSDGFPEQVTAESWVAFTRGEPTGILTAGGKGCRERQEVEGMAAPHGTLTIYY